jgi:hypothetical protein
MPAEIGELGNPLPATSKTVVEALVGDPGHKAARSVVE